VVYAVGSASPDESGHQPADLFRQQLGYLIGLLGLLVDSRADLTYLSSGGTIYGNSPVQPIPESAIPAPISDYGILKLTSESYVRMYAQTRGIRTRIVRLSNVYGPGQSWTSGYGLVGRLLHAARTAGTVPVYGDGSHVRDFLYVDDAAAIILELIHGGVVDPVINVGSGVGRTILDVAADVEAVTGLPVHLDYHPARPFDVHESVLDTRLMRERTSTEPCLLREGIARTWSWDHAHGSSVTPQPSKPTPATPVATGQGHPW
jgi:UDP-glucose 4-epimerase